SCEAAPRVAPRALVARADRDGIRVARVARDPARLHSARRAGRVRRRAGRHDRLASPPGRGAPRVRVAPPLPGLRPRLIVCAPTVSTDRMRPWLVVPLRFSPLSSPSPAVVQLRRQPPARSPLAGLAAP